jgi:hypothetical protein
MKGRFQMQGSKNLILPREINANRFFCHSHWLEIWSNHPMGPNEGNVVMDSGRTRNCSLFMNCYGGTEPANGREGWGGGVATREKEGKETKILFPCMAYSAMFDLLNSWKRYGRVYENL